MGGKSRARRRQRGGAGPEQRETGRAQRIARAVAEHDLTALKQLARTGDGLLTTQLRRQAWPLLLNFRSLADAGDRGAAHRDEDQVALDVRRTRLPDAPEIRRDVRARRLAELSQVVSGVLRSYPWLSYYQGFHELAMTFLCVFGSPRPAVEAAKMAALFFVRDAMGSSLDHVMQQLDLLYVLLEAACPRVHTLLAALDVPPFFAISWVLTWFAHDVESFADVCRLFDHLIVSPPLQVVHVAAALIRLREAEVLACERDFAAVHTALAALPATTADWLPVIDGACALQAEYPATKLQHMGACRLPRLSAVNTHEATWTRLDPARPLAFSSLVPTAAGHPLASAAPSKEMARVIDRTSTAQRARALALAHRWPLAAATLASATMLVYAWLVMQQGALA